MMPRQVLIKLALVFSLSYRACWSAPLLAERDSDASTSSALPSSSFPYVTPSPIDSGTQAQGVMYYQPPQSSVDSSSSSSPLPTSTALMEEEFASSSTTSSASPTILNPSSSPAAPTVPSSSTSAAVSSSTTLTTSSSITDTRPLVMAYFADWTVFERSPESIDWTKFDVINFAFAVPNEGFDLTWDDPNSSPGTLRRLVDSAISAGKKVVVSVGGWTGSKYFSPAVATDESRKIFVNNIVQTYHEFNLSGIDIDWEYPGHQGEGGNLVSSNDTANCLTFFQLLRSSLPTEAILTAAVTTFPFVDDKGKPMADVSAFAAVLDSVTIMAYDTFGSSQNPGPNAPFSDSCKNSTQPQANAVAAYNAWTSAGFPAAKLILGIASYGYRSASSASRLQSRDEGQVTFNTLVKQGKLVKTPPPSGDPTAPSTFAAGPGYTRDWDACSSTPFIYGNGEVYTYDDPESLRMKATWVKEVGMGGVNMWSLDGDTEEGDLVGAVSGAFEHD